MRHAFVLNGTPKCKRHLVGGRGAEYTQQSWEEDLAGLGHFSGRRECGRSEMPLREEKHFEIKGGNAGEEVSAAALQ